MTDARQDQPKALAQNSQKPPAKDPQQIVCESLQSDTRTLQQAFLVVADNRDKPGTVIGEMETTILTNALEVVSRSANEQVVGSRTHYKDMDADRSLQAAFKKALAIPGSDFSSLKDVTVLLNLEAVIDSSEKVTTAMGCKPPAKGSPGTPG